MNCIEHIYSEYAKSHCVTIDSRRVDTGAVFFALKGDNADGNMYADAALANGAALAVVDDPNLKDEPRMVYVPNVLECLQELARYHRDNLSIPIIGITGSNGKTTTKELVLKVLSSKFGTFATQGNYNNHIGVPLTVLSIRPSHSIAIVEMGANHIGEIALLCSIAKPTHGIITNVGMAHLEGFGSLEGVRTAKGELYQYLGASNGTVFHNADDQVLLSMLSKYFPGGVRVGYGSSTYSVRVVPNREPFLTVEFTASNGSLAQIRSNLTGSYNVNNILAAVCIGEFFSIPQSDIFTSIEAYAPSNSRSQVIDTGRNSVVLDAYNANPTSMEVALSSFAELPAKLPRVVFLGEMLELGEYAQQQHKHIVGIAKGMPFQKVVLVGNIYRGISDGCEYFDSLSECLDYYRANPLRDCLVLIKGSRGARMEGLLEVL